MNLQNTTILITGGKGFIGSNLKCKLENLGAKVKVFDRNDGNDICNKNDIEPFIKRKFDFIYHLAAFSGNQKSFLEAELCLKTNIYATAQLLELVAGHSKKTKIIFSNSRLEYGHPQYLPVDEQHPTVPLSFYGLSKLAATELAQVYGKTKKILTTVFRTSNAYGPNRSKKFKGYNVINYFIANARQGKPLPVYGDGSQLRDYIFIDDVVDAFILAMLPKTTGEIYNLGFGKEITLLEMAKLIIKTVGKGTIKFIKWPPDIQLTETGSYVSNISKFSSHTGFKPKISFEEGIKKSIETI